MYLVICKNRHGLSIDSSTPSLQEANKLAEFANERKINIEMGLTFHVRPFDLASINLEKLMEQKNECERYWLVLMAKELYQYKRLPIDSSTTPKSKACLSIFPTLGKRWINQR